MSSKTLTITKTQKKGYGPELKIEFDGYAYKLGFILSQKLTDTNDEDQQGIFSDGVITFYRPNDARVTVEFNGSITSNDPHVLMQQIIERVQMVKGAFDEAYPEHVVTTTHTFFG